MAWTLTRHRLMKSLPWASPLGKRYYEARMKGLLSKHIKIHCKVARMMRGLDAIREDDFLALASNQGLSEPASYELLSESLRRGILSPVPGMPLHYEVPIPSMAQFLRDGAHSRPEATKKPSSARRCTVQTKQKTAPRSSRNGQSAPVAAWGWPQRLRNRLPNGAGRQLSRCARTDCACRDRS